MSEMIDKEFWYKYAKDRISGAIAARDAAAAKLDNLLAIYWGIYTSSIVLGTFTGIIKVEEWWKLVILYLPSLIILLARWFSTYAQLPYDAEFNPIIVDDIIDNGYIATLKAKKERLFWANLLTLASTILIALAILICKFDFSSSYILKEVMTRDGIRIQGKTPANQDLSVFITGDNDTIRPLITPNLLSLSLKMKTGKNGDFDTTVRNSKISKNISCSVSWKDNKGNNETLFTTMK